VAGSCTGSNEKVCPVTDTQSRRLELATLLTAHARILKTSRARVTTATPVPRLIHAWPEAVPDLTRRSVL
jgi:hypothetical protein